ncbi:MAG TPA: right-handed parallel beta-helix repeat-containing protein [Verrucomicrobiae bacterium]|nr:right-handed parallel beta-helix repeat-containing protein [Verrucomicrobiae bacterium]
MKTKIPAMLAFLGCLPLMSIDALELTATQLEANIRAVTTGCPDFTITPPATGGATVDAVVTYGVSTNNSGLQNYTAFTNAIAHCKSQNAYKLIVPKGTYHVGNYGTHYGNGIFYFNGITNFIFDGQGSTFLMESKSYFVRVAGCSRLVLQNMTIGWNWSKENVQSLAQVQAIDPGGNYIDLLFPYENNPSTNAVIASDFAEVDGVNYNFSHQGFGTVGVWQMDTTKTVKVATNVIRYFDDTTVVSTDWFHHNGTQVGQYCLIRHFEYDYHGFETSGSDNLIYSNLTVYSTLGMGFHFHDNQYCEIIDSKLIREPGSIYHLSGSADGINVGNSLGYFKIINTEVGNTGDDAINIHDTLSQGVKVTGTFSLIASNVISWQNPFSVGQTIELRGKDFAPLSPAWSSTLTAVGAYSDGTSKTVALTSMAALPGSLDINSIIFNDHYNSGNYIVSGCNIHDNKVRGIIVHNSNGTIENNQFIRNYDPGLFLVCLATKYAEGCNPSNVVVKNNVFDGNDIRRNAFPSMPNNVVIAGETTPSGIVSYPVCKNVILEYNLVKNCSYAGLEIASATNVLIKNNTFESPNQTNDLSSVLGCVMILKSSGVVFNHNDLVLDAGVTSYKTNIYVDTATATNNIFVDPFIPRTLPAVWDSWDIGSVGVGGFAAFTNGTYTVNGSGADIWGTDDSFQFVYQPWSGDGQIVTRVAAIQNTDPWAKAGIMFRETLDADSRNEVLFVSPASGVSMQGRTTTDGLTSTINTVAGIAAPRWLSLVRLGTCLSGYQSADGINWSLVGTNVNVMTGSIYVGLAVTSKSNSILNASTFDHVAVSGAWQSQDIGSVGVTGGSLINYSNGLFTVQGSGSDIWASADAFRFLYQGCSGDSAIIARVTGVQGTSPWAKAAVMMRETLATNSRNTILFLSPSNGVSFQGRTTTGGLTVTIAGITNLVAPQWIQLVRSGANMNTYKSADGVNWTWVGTQSNGIASSYYIGLAVTSKSNNVLNTSTFDNVSVQSAWTGGDIGPVGVPGGATIDDSTGTFLVSGSGTDIWGTDDAFQYVDQPLYGNGEIVAHVNNVGNTSAWAKSGVMIRETLSSSSKNAFLSVTATNGITFQGRASAGGLTATFNTVAGISAPCWLKLNRSGSSLTASRSADGASWTLISAQTVAMSTNACIGLAVGSKNNVMLNTATFDKVTITPAP